MSAEEPPRYRVRVGLDCHLCGTFADSSEVYATWLEPVTLWNRELRSGVQTQVCPRCARRSLRYALRYWIRVRWRLRIGRLSYILGPPGYGSCFRCRTSWFFAKHHATSYGHHACFPLCERCWEELTPEQRLPFYERLVHEWRRGGYPLDPETRRRLVEAVLAGK